VKNIKKMVLLFTASAAFINTCKIVKYILHVIVKCDGVALVGYMLCYVLFSSHIVY
jgi:hypothetical protein